MLQKAALLALLILVTYAILTKTFEKPVTYKSAGRVMPTPQPAAASPTFQLPEPAPPVQSPVRSQGQAEQSPEPANSLSAEAPVGYQSDTVNLNQFYKDNPEIFNKGAGTTHAPDVTEWEKQSSAMFNVQQGGGANGAPTTIEPYNFELGGIGEWTPLA